MDILTLSFLGFCIVLFCLYFVVPRKMQWSLLLVFSAFFYIQAGLLAVGYIFISSAITFVAAIALEEINKRNKIEIASSDGVEEKAKVRTAGIKEKKKICMTALFVVFGIWGVVKYSTFFLTSVNKVFLVFKIGKQFGMPDFFMPLGISFYSFHAAGYLVDIYRGKYKLYPR